MKLIIQPEGSSICGQCCVAMAIKKPLSTVIKVFGHQHSTRTIELHRAFKYFGTITDKRLTRNKTNTVFPKICILKITYDWRKSNGHWVYYNKGICYCPSGDVHHWSDYLKYPLMGRITSFLPIP